MPESSAATLRRAAPFAAFACATAAFTILAGLMMFSRFMLYDDEGYVLISLRNFAEHGRLYGDVYSQYGPFPHVCFYLLNLAGMPLTHTAGRLITIAAWAGAGLCAAAIVWRAARSHALMAAVLAAVIIYLWVMVSEPSHPGGQIVIVVAVLAAFGAHWLAAERTRAWALLAGVGVAALLWTKINVGVFAAISVGALGMLHHRDSGVRRWARWIVPAGFALLPFALMRPLLSTGWVQTYALVFAVSAATASAAASLDARSILGWREIRPLLAGGAALSAIVFGVVLARGTTPAELLDGVLLGPLKHPANFSLKFPWAPGTHAVAAASAALFAVACWLRRSGRGGVADRAVVTLRLAAALSLMPVVLRFPAESPDMAVLSFGLPCLWIFIWPLGGETAPAGIARTWIALLLLGQFLHPFPVPGSQIAWGTFLAIPLAALGAVESVRWLAQRLPMPPARVRTWMIAAGLTCVTFCAFAGHRLWLMARHGFDGRLLGLRGAESVRLPDATVGLYRLLVMNATTHSDLLFSLPGMFSLNLWSDLPTPTLANVTHWFSLLSEERQQGIIRALEAHPRAVVIVQREHIEFLQKRGLTPGGTLYRYLERTFAPAFTIDGFEFQVRKNREINPLLTAEVFRHAGAGTAEPDTRLLLHVWLPGQTPIASVEIVSAFGGAPPRVLRAADVRVEVTPVTLQGRPRGPTATRQLPLTLDGPANVALYFDGKDQRFGLASTLIVPRGSDGAELALLRLRP